MPSQQIVKIYYNSHFFFDMGSLVLIAQILFVNKAICGYCLDVQYSFSVSGSYGFV